MAPEAPVHQSCVCVCMYVCMYVYIYICIHSRNTQVICTQPGSVQAYEHTYILYDT